MVYHVNKKSILLFSSLLILSLLLYIFINKPVSTIAEEGACGEVRFIGVALDEEMDCTGGTCCYGGYRLEVEVEEILENPNGCLKEGDYVYVCYPERLNIISGEKVEVYGLKYGTTGCPLQYCDAVVVNPSINPDYYIKRFEWEVLEGIAVVETDEATITKYCRNNCKEYTVQAKIISNVDESGIYFGDTIYLYYPSSLGLKEGDVVSFSGYVQDGDVVAFGEEFYVERIVSYVYLECEPDFLYSGDTIHVRVSVLNGVEGIVAIDASYFSGEEVYVYN
ncbi:hypothetical protein DRJ16_07680, partial [Candidatus Woesearchaeota archaeon]